MTDPADLQRSIAASPEATRRVLAYLEAHGQEHSGRISGATLAAVCGVSPRAWRMWVGGERAMPTSAERLLRLVSGIDE